MLFCILKIILILIAVLSFIAASKYKGIAFFLFTTISILLLISAIILHLFL